MFGFESLGQAACASILLLVMVITVIALATSSSGSSGGRKSSYYPDELPSKTPGGSNTQWADRSDEGQ